MERHSDTDSDRHKLPTRPPKAPLAAWPSPVLAYSVVEGAVLRNRAVFYSAATARTTSSLAMVPLLSSTPSCPPPDQLDSLCKAPRPCTQCLRFLAHPPVPREARLGSSRAFPRQHPCTPHDHTRRSSILRESTCPSQAAGIHRSEVRTS
jgi:hypothetical protein